jgi:predicted Zn finger-like uncharacterized protein
MSLTVTCPKCHAAFDVPNDLAEQPVRCHRCEHVFRPGEAHTEPLATAIQPGLALPLATPKKTVEEPEERPFRRPASPRAPFPWPSILIVTVGLLLLLLVMSGGFNLWFLTHADDPFRNAAAAREAAELARQQAVQAERAAAQAEAVRQEAQRKEAALQRRVDELTRQVEALKGELDEARRK